jgi:branched-chain amino acid transport system substrate-binding protein
VPQQGTNVFNKLINGDKVSLIMGPTLSNTAKITDPIAQKAGVPVLAISNTISGITEIGDYIFRDSLTENVVIPHTVKVAKEKLGLKKVAILYGNDDAMTKATYEVFKKELQAAGIQILSEQVFAKGDRDFSPQLTQIKAQNPDAIIAAALAEEASGIASQARQLGIPKTVRIIGGNGLNSPGLIKNAGDAAEGIIVGAAWNITSTAPLNVKFVNDFTKKYNHARISSQPKRMRVFKSFIRRQKRPVGVQIERRFEMPLPRSRTSIPCWVVSLLPKAAMPTTRV